MQTPLLSETEIRISFYTTETDCKDTQFGGIIRCYLHYMNIVYYQRSGAVHYSACTVGPEEENNE